MPAVVICIGRDIEKVGRKNTDPEEYARPSGVFTPDQARSFKDVLRFLNDKDRDILYLIFVSGKKQKDVLKLLGRTQSSLAYDIKRIRRRLKFIFYLHSVFDIFVNFTQTQTEYFNPEERSILTLMFYTSSFTMTSEVMNVSQVRVRYAYNKCLERMEQLEMWDAYEIFIVIRSNLNTVKRAYKGSDRKVSDPCVVI